jgi:hypothetical protein
MSDRGLPAVSAPKFDARVDDAAGLSLVLSGTADLRVQQELETFLFAVNDLALARRASEVAVDLRKLEFMNSSCFKAFVGWIGQLQEVERERQYRIRFLSDPRMLWQRRSLHALSCFAVDLITIETS